jgi:hypothetical protein
MTLKQAMLRWALCMIVCGGLLYWDSLPPAPGDKPSPKLVEMFNREIDAEIVRIAAPPSLYTLGPNYRPDAADRAHEWLSELREVVTHCENYSRLMRRGHNAHVFKATLQSGEKISGTAHISGVVSTARCYPDSVTEMRVTFEGGRVIQVTTDGSEQTRSLESAQQVVSGVVRGLVSYDARQNPERYYVEVPQEPDYAKEWAGP